MQRTRLRECVQDDVRVLPVFKISVAGADSGIDLATRVVLRLRPVVPVATHGQF